MGLPDGKADTLQEWVAAHDAALRAYVGRRVRSHAHAEDVVQDTYVRLLRAGPDVARVHNPRGFLFRIASNLMADAFRRQRTRREETALDDAPPYALRDDGAASPERSLAGRQALAGLEEALAALTPKAQACIHLVRFEGLTPRETARVLGMTEKAVTRQLERGLAALAAKLVQNGF